MCDFSKIVLPNVTRTRAILAEAEKIKAKPVLDESDLERLAGLRTELVGLCPALRYGWHEGVPVVDLWAELLKVEGEGGK